MTIQKVVFLDKEGEIVHSVESGALSFDSSNIFPVVIESYLWSKDKQLRSSEDYQDKIERVYKPDEVQEGVKVMLQDDHRRMQLIKTFSYGGRVLEVGCSQGTASIKIAELPNVKEVSGIDIRQSAIDQGKQLIQELVHKNEITQDTARKIKLEKISIEELPMGYGMYDSVCAYEVLEHMAPQDLISSFQHLYGFLKPEGNLYISVPNRFPATKYDQEGRTRWRWHDHRNFFSKISLEIFLKNYFNEVKFYPLYEDESVDDSIYLICECNGKKV